MSAVNFLWQAELLLAEGPGGDGGLLAWLRGKIDRLLAALVRLAGAGEDDLEEEWEVNSEGFRKDVERRVGELAGERVAHGLKWLDAAVEDLLDEVESAMDGSGSMMLVEGWRGLREMREHIGWVKGFFQVLSEREQEILEGGRTA